MSMTFWYWVSHMTEIQVNFFPPSSPWLRHLALNSWWLLLSFLSFMEHVCMTGAVNERRQKQNQGRTWFTLAAAANGAAYTSLMERNFSHCSIDSVSQILQGSNAPSSPVFPSPQMFSVLQMMCLGLPNPIKTFLYHISQWCCIFFLLILFRVLINTDQTYY